MNTTHQFRRLPAQCAQYVIEHSRLRSTRVLCPECLSREQVTAHLLPSAFAPPQLQLDWIAMSSINVANAEQRYRFYWGFCPHCSEIWYCTNAPKELESTVVDSVLQQLSEQTDAICNRFAGKKE